MKGAFVRREVGQVRDDDVDEARDGLEEVAFAYENAIGHARTCCIACRSEHGRADGDDHQAGAQVEPRIEPVGDDPP